MREKDLANAIHKRLSGGNGGLVDRSALSSPTLRFSLQQQLEPCCNNLAKRVADIAHTIIYLALIYCS